MYVLSGKRFYNRERIRGIIISPLAVSPSTLSWLVDILELRKDWLFEFHRREGGMKDIWCILYLDAAIVSLS